MLLYTGPNLSLAIDTILAFDQIDFKCQDCYVFILHTKKIIHIFYKLGLKSCHKIKNQKKKLKNKYKYTKTMWKNQNWPYTGGRTESLTDPSDPIDRLEVPSPLFAATLGDLNDDALTKNGGVIENTHLSDLTIGSSFSSRL